MYLQSWEVARKAALRNAPAPSSKYLSILILKPDFKRFVSIFFYREQCYKSRKNFYPNVKCYRFVKY